MIKRIKIKNKKSQQEIIGFVLIVMIVVIVGVIFLGISLRQDRADKGVSIDDAEIANFLSVSMAYTTDCVINEPIFADIQDLTKECFESKTSYCLNDNESEGIGGVQKRLVCDVLNTDYSEMLNKLWPSGTERPIKGIKLTAYSQTGTGENMMKSPNFLEIEQGDSTLCSVKRAGKHSIYSRSNNIIIELEVCN